MIPVPWVHRDEPKLHDLMARARDLGLPIEIVAGSAPGWSDPWSRMRRVYVKADERGWRSWLVDELGYVIGTDDVQLARLAGREGEAMGQ